MMESKDKIDLAPRAGLVAHSVLQLIGTSGKFHARIVMQDLIKHVMDLDKKIKELPED